ncbi:MAG: cell division protein ZapA [Rickettsiales bacterium]|nr:cell division protein ZapA [Rickettsiales bacterium]
MPVISLKIYNTTHNISCNEGDEEQLRALAVKFDKQVINLAKVFPNSNDKTLYLIAALTLLDKSDEKVSEPSINKNNPLELVTEIFQALTAKIDLLTQKVEKL